MRTIKKYALTTGASFKVKLPKGYAILRVGIEERCPHLWAIVETENPEVLASLNMVNTNAPMPAFDGMQYLGSVQIPGNPFYSHLFIDTNGDVPVPVKPTAAPAPQSEGQGGNPPA